VHPAELMIVMIHSAGIVSQIPFTKRITTQRAKARHRSVWRDA